ncbi:universal stress protein [Burkholderia anthina]|uniref:universal stress protein n=1 Tax=Burkholderia anthina TaxID=179879 RepID=UPI001588B915|nr:universal stress protein [Burkholderia anthina]
MYRNIMVAVDGSPSSDRALDEGLKMAGSSGARLFAVFVVDKSLLITYAGRLDPDALLDEVRRDGAAVLRSAARTISRAAVNGETEIVETELGQDIAERLQRYVVDRSIDLAVIGTHGRRGVRRLLLGSVAERFLRGSSCPVLLVRSRDAAQAAGAAAGHRAAG